MKASYYAIPTVMILASLFFVIKGAQAKKEAEIAKSQIVIHEVTDSKLEAAKTADIISAANAIEGFAAKCKLPITVEIKRREIILTSEPVKVQLSDPSASQASPAESKEDKEETLRDPGQVMAFFRNIATLPYKMTYKNLCIGLDCKAAIEATISFGEQPPAAPTENQPPAPQQQSSQAPAPPQAK